MKTVNYPTFAFNQAGLSDMLDSIAAGKFSLMEAASGSERDYNINIADGKVSVTSNIENDTWTKSVAMPEGAVLHYRGIEMDGIKCLAFWAASWGLAHRDLNLLRVQLTSFMKEPRTSQLTIQLSPEAILTGWTIGSKGTGYELAQIPTWEGQTGVAGRTPITLEEIIVREDELFLNNLWINVSPTEDYSVSYDEENSSVTIRGIDVTAETANDVGTLMVVPYEEVNYNSPIMETLGLVPPGQTKPVLIYSDDTGRQIAHIEETFDDVTYDTYVLSHGQGNLTDQLTLGANALYNEQLLEVLIHRYTKLNADLPHTANEKTIKLLEQIKTLQAERYALRGVAGILGTNEQLPEVTGNEPLVQDVADSNPL